MKENVINKTVLIYQDKIYKASTFSNNYIYPQNAIDLYQNELHINIFAINITRNHTHLLKKKNRTSAYA